ncbi:MAG: methyltransferase [Oscillospiraceae bacterium]|nr:methyltransferase [Oscillospiraceae bacterium]
MEQLHNGYTLELSPGAFPLSTDSVVLSGFARLSKNVKVLDLCSGCGTLGLLLCAEHPGCSVTGIEIDKAAHRMALQNAQRNDLSHRLFGIHGSIADAKTLVGAGSFDACICNPPYFSGGIPSATLSGARQETLCALSHVIAAAGWALRFGGDLFLVHRPERLAELFVCADENHLEPKRMQLLRHRQGGPISLVLVQLRKGAKAGLIWEEEALFDEKGQPTQYYRKLYHT